MNTRMVLTVALGFCLLLIFPVMADSEGRNWAFVQSSETDGTSWRGDRYAKCIPAGRSGTQGRTLIYKVGEERDEWLHSFDWYTPTIYLAGAANGTSVVRLGRWNQGHRASRDHLALALYFDGKLLKEYSTLDIVGSEDNVRSSVSHYQWYKRILGYRWLRSDQAKVLVFGFVLEAIDGRLVCFNVQTGQIMVGWEPERKE